jgi:hypothetical protein
VIKWLTKSTDAIHDITVETTSDTFERCSNGGTIIPIGTKIIVEVTEVTASQLKWNTTNLTPHMIGTCDTTFNPGDYFNFMAAVYLFLSSGINIPIIISTGIIEPIYFVPFEIPIYVDLKPQTWIDFDSYESFFESTLSLMFASWDSSSVDAVQSEVNNVMTYTSVFTASTVMDPTSNASLGSTSLFSYNMTTGELIEAENHYTMDGFITSAQFNTISDYSIEKTAVTDPTTPFNFLAFLSENKWYFIGGGVGIIVIGATVGIVLDVKKSRTSTKSTKKKPTKKKK